MICGAKFLLKLLHGLISILETETLERYKKISHDFNLWAFQCLREVMTPAEESNVKKEIDFIDQEVKNIYKTRIHELKGKDYELKSNQIPSDNSKTMVENIQPTRLDLIFQGMESALKEKGAIKSGPTARKVYHLIVTLFIDIVQLKLLSEKELSYFLNNTANGKRILSYSLTKLGKFHQMPDMKEFIHESFYGPESNLEALLLSCEWKFEFFDRSSNLLEKKLTPTF
jgi:hypothetical protein